MKVGIINGGGDCPGLNTVIDSIVRVLYPDYTIYGFYKGFEGILKKEYIELTPDFTLPFRFEGGTFLKTVNKGVFASKTGLGESRNIEDDIISQTIQSYKELGLEGLISLGGDGSMSIANQLAKHGLNIIGVPKSIDNDLMGTDMTFGFQTAVEIATEALDRLETTAFSHDRVMILEVMGRSAGWIGLYSGLAGGANMILIPEIPFSWDILLKHVKDRTTQGKKNMLIVVSEGAMPDGGEVITRDIGATSSETLLGGIGEAVEKFLNNDPDIESRSTTLGHIQRGGSPCAFDRVLSRSLGSEAAQLFMQKKFGQMVTYRNGAFKHISIANAVQEIKHIEPQDHLIQMAKSMGVCFGDEEVKHFQ